MFLTKAEDYLVLICGHSGVGKSTFLKILSGEIDPTTGSFSITPGERMSVLKQNHFEFDQLPVLQTVLMGNKKLYDLKNEMDAIYAKSDFTEEGSDSLFFYAGRKCSITRSILIPRLPLTKAKLVSMGWVSSHANKASIVSKR